MMNFVLNMMNCEFKMMSFAFKMMGCAGRASTYASEQVGFSIVFDRVSSELWSICEAGVTDPGPGQQ